MLYSFVQFIGWLISKFIGRVFLRTRFKGRKNIKSLKEGGVVFIANHQSAFDPFLISAGISFSYFLKVKCFRYLTFYKFISMKWYGFMIWLSGAYPVYPGKGSLEKTLRSTIKILKEKQNVLFFPTGKRSNACVPGEARPGIAYLAKTLDPILVPVQVGNTYDINFWDFILRKRKVTIKYGKPFHYQDASSENNDLRKLAQDIMVRVCKMDS